MIDLLANKTGCVYVLLGYDFFCGHPSLPPSIFRCQFLAREVSLPFKLLYGSLDSVNDTEARTFDRLVQYGVPLLSHVRFPSDELGAGSIDLLYGCRLKEYVNPLVRSPNNQTDFMQMLRHFSRSGEAFSADTVSNYLNANGF